MAKRVLRILIVEDDALIGLDLEDMLGDLGHSVLEIAGSPDQAMIYLDRFKDRVDAVLLDANLGGASSLPVAEALSDRNIPFIVTSGYEPDELRREGFDAPYVSKPYLSADIETALQTVLR